MGLMVGMYNVMVMDVNNCEMIVDVEVLVVDQVEIVFFSVVDVICVGVQDGEIVVVFNGGILFYIWSSLLIGLMVGVYNFIVMDVVGCMDVLVVSVNELVVLLFSINVIVVGCFGESNGVIDLSVIGGILFYDYDWSGIVIIEDLSGI